MLEEVVSNQNSMRNIKLVIAYDGTCYHGWQRQLDDVITVQQVVEEAIGKALERCGGRCADGVKLRAAGRTDTGVHALGQVVNFFAEVPVPIDRLWRIINNYLPEDVCVRSSQYVPDEFDATKTAVSKLYRYTVYNRRVELPRLIRSVEGVSQSAYYYPVELISSDGRCGFEAMVKAADLLVGEHDFRSFAASADQRKSTVRTLHSCRVWRESHYIYFDLEGNGFLYHMVRNIVGALLEVGRGRWPVEKIAQVLAARDRTAAGPMAPANGLCMQWVKYGD